MRIRSILFASGGALAQERATGLAVGAARHLHIAIRCQGDTRRESRGRAARCGPLDVPDWAPVVAATDGTSPAFIRELMRRATMHAAESRTPVTTAHLTSSVEELRHQGGALTAALLGAQPR